MATLYWSYSLRNWAKKISAQLRYVWFCLRHMIPQLSHSSSSRKTWHAHRTAQIVTLRVQFFSSPYQSSGGNVTALFFDTIKPMLRLSIECAENVSGIANHYKIIIFSANERQQCRVSISVRCLHRSLSHILCQINCISHRATTVNSKRCAQVYWLLPIAAVNIIKISSSDRYRIVFSNTTLLLVCVCVSMSPRLPFGVGSHRDRRALCFCCVWICTIITMIIVVRVATTRRHIASVNGVSHAADTDASL